MQFIITLHNALAGSSKLSMRNKLHILIFAINDGPLGLYIYERSLLLALMD